MTEIYRDSAGEWRFRVKGRNGEIVATGEGYTRKHDAERGLEDLRRILDETDKGKIVHTNISRNEMALWIFAGITTQRPPADLATDDAIRDILGLADGDKIWKVYQNAADYTLDKLCENFPRGRAS